MKRSHYIVAIVLIILLAAFIFARPTTNEQKIIRDCFDNGGSFNVTTQTCTQGTQSGSPVSNVKSQIPQTAKTTSNSSVSTSITIPANVTMLPMYNSTD